jgi:hypothetical protein
MLRNLAGATSLALMVGTPAEATGKHLTILASVPELAFPFFVYMMGQMRDGEKPKEQVTQLAPVAITRDNI